jgi:cyclic pyranopterin monophosphate synthase
MMLEVIHHRISEKGLQVAELSHIDDQGRARMVDVGDKPVTRRRASAEGELRCASETLAAVKAGQAPKGSVVATAELAGVIAGKRTADLIPLCHPLPLSKVEVSIGLDEGLPGFRVAAMVRTEGRTGVEMEALTAVSVACLTLFDMLKAIDRTMTIGKIRVTSKEGGRSGSWQEA